MTDKVLIDRSVLEQALEALTNCASEYGHRCNRCDSEVDPEAKVAAALSAALEQSPVEQPVAWMFQHEETGRIMYVDAQQVEWGFEQNNPRWVKVRPAYLHPQPPRQPLTCNSCKGLGRVYRGCNEWAACVHCNTTGIGGER